MIFLSRLDFLAIISWSIARLMNSETELMPHSWWRSISEDIAFQREGLIFIVILLSFFG